MNCDLLGGNLLSANFTLTAHSNHTNWTSPSSLNANSVFDCLVRQTDVEGSTMKPRPGRLISNDVKRVLEIVFQIVIFIVTSVFGVVANIINVIVYKKQGLKESITLGFFALSLSDLFNASLPLVISGCYIAKFVFPDSPINFILIHYVSTSWLRQLTYSFSCITTAFLSLERCFCVILPLKVKLIFTRRRTLVILLTILIFHVLCNIPIFATHQLRWMKDPGPNNTATFHLWYAPYREEIEAFNYILLSIITPTVSQVILICSVVVMVIGLIESSKFSRGSRVPLTITETAATASPLPISSRSATASPPQEPPSPTTIISTTKTKMEKTPQTKQGAGLNSRDIRLVKAVVFLVAILSVGNIPYLALMYAMLMEPKLDIGRSYHNTYSVMFSVSIAMATINASFNIFVYYNTSSRYREILKETFSCLKIRNNKI